MCWGVDKPSIPLLFLFGTLVTKLWRFLRGCRRTVILSINRFERKKNIMLAVEAFAVLRDQCAAARAPGVTLVLAGGYDPRVAENVEYHAEIEARVDALGLTDAVSLRRSISNDEKNTLVRTCGCVSWLKPACFCWFGWFVFWLDGCSFG